jgi:hypothetical protein
MSINTNLPPKKIGDKSFYNFIAKCISKDWIVLIPAGDCDRYDCVIDKGNSFERVQVKTGRYKNGSIVFAVCSTHYHTKLGQVTHNYRQTYIGQIEFFGVFCPELNRSYLVPINCTGNISCSLRVDEFEKSQGNKPIKWAKDYEI